MKKLLLLCLVAVIIALAAKPVNTLLTSAVSLAARQTCSLHFASGLPVEWVQETYVNAHVSPVGPLLHYDIDVQQKRVDTSLLGLFSASAEYREGFACTLDNGLPLAELAPPLRRDVKPVPIAVTAREAYFDATALDNAIMNAFVEPNEDMPRQTTAVLVLHRGQLVAEHYAAGVDQATPLPGFSMAKSLVATLMGLLVQHKGLDIHDAISDAGELSASGVTYDQLLRMISGIDVTENGSGLDANSIMLTQSHDAAAYAISQGMSAAPGDVYAYTGGGPVVLSQAFNRLAADSPTLAYQFIDDELFQPMGLNSIVLEVDGVGTFLGSSFMLASALDWARLGQLYLQDGRMQGRQILPLGWSDYVSRVTEQSGAKEYGAGFWTAKNGGRDVKIPNQARLPEDAYFMHGMMNQAVYILPSQSLVIVRLGATRSYVMSGELELVAGVIAALR